MSEETKVTEVEEKKLNTKEKSLVIVGGIITIGAVVIGYKLSSKMTTYRIGLGLEKCFKHDSTLESHMKNVLNEVASEMKKK